MILALAIHARHHKGAWDLDNERMRRRREAAAMVLLAVAVWLGAEYSEAFEWFAGWSARHEEWDVDEFVIVVVPFLALAYAILGHLRGRRLAVEVARRKRSGGQLSRLSAAVEAATDAIAVADAQGPDRVRQRGSGDHVWVRQRRGAGRSGLDRAHLPPDGVEQEREEQVGRLVETGEPNGIWELRDD